jgi:hypothetical protein
MRLAGTEQARGRGVLVLAFAAVLGLVALLAGPAGAQTSGTSTATGGSVSSGSADATGGSVSSGEANASGGSTASGEATASGGSVASGCSTASNNSTASGGLCPPTTTTTIVTTTTTTVGGTTTTTSGVTATTAGPTPGRLAVTGSEPNRLVQGAMVALVAGLLLVLLGLDGPARGARQSNGTQA